MPDKGELCEYEQKFFFLCDIGLIEELENNSETSKLPIPPDYFLTADIFIAACGATPLFLRIWCNGSPNSA